MVPFSTHKVEHFTHHRYTNQPDKDPDYVVSGMRDGFFAFLVCGFRFLWIQNTFLFRDYWPTAPRRVKAAYIAEVLFAIGWRVAFITLVARENAWALLLFGYLAGAFFVAYWFAYRPHLPYPDSTRYRNTNSLIMPGWMKPLEWFTRPEPALCAPPVPAGAVLSLPRIASPYRAGHARSRYAYDRYFQPTQRRKRRHPIAHHGVVLMFRQYLCEICGHIYDEALGAPQEGIAPGTRWEDVPDSWVCPDCGVTKSDFVLL